MAILPLPVDSILDFITTVHYSVIATIDIKLVYATIFTAKWIQNDSIKTFIQ